MTHLRAGYQTPPPLESTGSLSLLTNYDQTGNTQLHINKSKVRNWFILFINFVAIWRDLLGLTSVLGLSANRNTNIVYIFRSHNRHNFRCLHCLIFLFIFQTMSQARPEGSWFKFSFHPYEYGVLQGSILEPLFFQSICFPCVIGESSFVAGGQC